MAKSVFISKGDSESIDEINSDYHDGLCDFVESESEVNQFSKIDFNYVVLDKGDDKVVLFFLV